MEPQHQTKTFDEALTLVGSFGRFHCWLFLVNIFFHFTLPWLTVVITFIGASPEHTCQTHVGFNISNSVTLAKGSQGSDEVLYSSCERYVNPELKNDTEGCTEGWVYDDSVYGETLVSEWDLVCSKEGLVDISQSLMMLGGCLGSVCAGILADLYGRKPVIIGSLLIYAISGCVLVFSPSFIIFVVLFTINGTAQPGFWFNCHVLLMEYLLPERRAFISSWPPLFQSFGAVALSILAFYIRDWRYLQAVLMIPAVLVLTVSWAIPESARWQVSRNNVAKGEKLLKKIASINKKDSVGPFLTDLSTKENLGEHKKSSVEKESHCKEGFSLEEKVSELPTVSAKVTEMSDDVILMGQNKASFLDILRPPVLFITICMCTTRLTYGLVFSGFALNTGSLAGNPYLNFMIGSLLEIPAKLFPLFVIGRFGARNLAVIFYFLSGLALIVIIVLPTETNNGTNFDEVITWVSLIGRCLITATLASILLLPMELYPTQQRTLGSGVAEFFGRLGGVVAPLLLYLDNLVPNTSLITMAVTSMLSALMTFFLPETLNEPHPETIDDLKKLMKKKRRIFPSSKSST